MRAIMILLLRLLLRVLLVEAASRKKFSVPSVCSQCEPIVSEKS